MRQWWSNVVFIAKLLTVSVLAALMPDPSRKTKQKRGSRKELRMNRSLDAIKTFFDPHPGFAGAAIPIPEAVRRVANELNGKTASLRDAIARIQAVTKGRVSVAENYDFIYLELTESNGTRHGFRVISFK